MTAQEEQAAKFQIIEDRKQARARVTIFKNRARLISESLFEVAKILATNPERLNVSQTVPEHKLGTLIDINLDDLDSAKIRTVVKELCVAIERLEQLNDDVRHLDID